MQTLHPSTYSRDNMQKFKLKKKHGDWFRIGINKIHLMKPTENWFILCGQSADLRTDHGLYPPTRKPHGLTRETRKFMDINLLVHTRRGSSILSFLRYNTNIFSTPSTPCYVKHEQAPFSWAYIQNVKTWCFSNLWKRYYLPSTDISRLSQRYLASFIVVYMSS